MLGLHSSIYSHNKFLSEKLDYSTLKTPMTGILRTVGFEKGFTEKKGTFRSELRADESVCSHFRNEWS